MIVERYVRGNVVAFTSTPLDVAGEPIAPGTVDLTVNFLASGARDSATVAMTQLTDGSYYAEWDSSDADKGCVDWCVRTENPASADEGRFELTANLANT